LDLNIPSIIVKGSPVQKALSSGHSGGVIGIVQDAATNKILDALEHCVWNSVDHDWSKLVIL
jgi:hypothetical protein